MWKLPAALFLEHVLHLVAWKSIDRQRDRFVSEAKAAVEKSQNGAGGGDPTFSASSRPKSVSGSLPPSGTQIVPDFFPRPRASEAQRFRIRGTRMPLIKKQAVIVLQEIPIKVSVEEILDDYARFIHSSPDLVNSVLKKLARACKSRNTGSGVMRAGTRRMRHKLRTRRGKDDAACLRSRVFLAALLAMATGA